MEIPGMKYPFSLGVRGKNKLERQGGQSKRWVNVNHSDWSEPTWSKVSCKANLVDRSLGPKKYAYFDTDIAVMTEYEDPVLNMIIYDLAPAKSALFDLDAPPQQNIEQLYDWATIDAINIAIPNRINRVENPLYPISAIGGILYFAHYIRKLRRSPRDNL
tara:strand:+ start:267 stop:746 length:480 start_codon:yes stop_codon:yes gene_type:complete